MNAMETLEEAILTDYNWLFSKREDLCQEKNMVVVKIMIAASTKKPQMKLLAKQLKLTNAISNIDINMHHRVLQMRCLPLYQEANITNDDIEGILFPTWIEPDDTEEVQNG